MALSLAELDALNDNKNNPPPPPPPNPGFKPVDPPAPDLEAERQKQAKAAEEANIAAGKNADGSEKTPATPADPANPQLTDQEKANIAAGKNADGTEKTAEQIEAEKKQAEEDAAAEEDDLALWQDVDKIWGQEFKVEYKNAAGEEVHPNSPEGIFIRERAVAAWAIEDFEDHLAKRDPRLYEYILHRQAGGTDEDFFARKTVTLPVYEEFQNSVDLKSKVVSDSLRIKGVPENVIKFTLEDAIKNKTLDPLAETAYKESQAAQQKEIDRINQQTAREKAEYERSVAILDKSLKEDMVSGMKIIIPEAKKIEFDKFVRERIQVLENNQFAIINPIDQKNLPKILDALYFQFTNGNLADLVQRNAETKNVKRLQRHVQQSQQTPKGGELPISRKKTLGEL